MEETGDPFTGKKKEELKKFLRYYCRHYRDDDHRTN